MKYFYLLLFLSSTVVSDEFDWTSTNIAIAEVTFPIESDSIYIVVGSHCYGDTGRCDISAKFSTSKKNEVEFLRVMADSEAHLSVKGNRVEISLDYYPIGSEEGLRISKNYEWNTKSQMLEMKDSAEHPIDI